MEFDRIYTEIDLGHIEENMEAMEKNLRPGTKMYGVVKTDAYGHGAVPVAKTIDRFVCGYAVATVEEGVQLRKHGITKEILILGPVAAPRYEECIRQELCMPVFELDKAEGMSEAAEKLKKTAHVHIAVDTGMSRIGFIPCEESLDTVEKISKLPGLEVEGIFTHFARADEKTIEPAREPFRKYITFVEELEKRGVMIPIHHVANSASIIGFPEANLDMVRSGITTYGLYPSDEVSKDVLVLEPAMQWKSIISYIKTVEPGTSISYGGTFTAKEKMTVATIPVGYADGMKRDLSGKGRVLIHGQYAPILGRICMDQFMVDVSHIKEAAIGDTVTIFGKDGEKNIPVEEIAEKSHSFNYEFVCSITNRVPRKYLGE